MWDKLRVLARCAGTLSWWRIRVSIDLGLVITLPKAGNFYNGCFRGNSLSVVESSWNVALEFVWKVETIVENLSFIGQEVKIISPKNWVALGYDTHDKLFVLVPNNSKEKSTSFIEGTCTGNSNMWYGKAVNAS